MSQYADDRRLTTRVLKYWSRLIPEGKVMPLYGTFQKEAMVDVWGQCMLISLQPSEKGSYRFKCEEMGKAASDLVGKQAIGKPINKTGGHKMFGRRFIDASTKAIERFEPAYDSGNFVSDKQEMVKYRTCFLPFVNSNQEVTHLLVGLSWRSFK